MASYRPRLLLFVAPLLGFLLALNAARSDMIGVFGDDAIYVSTAESLAVGQGFRAAVLPTAPLVAKYPPGFPAVLALLAAAGAPLGTAAFVLNAACFALAIHLLAGVLLGRLGASPGEQLAAGLLMAVSLPVLLIMGAVLSEALWTSLLAGQVVLLQVPEGGRRRAVFLGLLVAAGCLVRSVNVPLGVAVVALSVLRRDRASALAATVALVVQRVVRALVLPSPDADPGLHYFASYQTHTGYYLDPLASGHPAEFASRLATVLASNLDEGSRAWGEFVLPVGHVTSEAAPEALRYVGLAVLGLGLWGLGRRAPVLLGLVATYVVVFLAWPWPFASRFWVPVQGLVVVGLLLASREWQSGRLVVGIGVLFGLVGHGMQPCYALKARLVPTPVATSAEEAAVDEALTWFDLRLGERDVLVDGFESLWLARRCGSQGQDLRSLLPPERSLAGAFRQPMPGAETLADELWPALRELRARVPAEHRVLVGGRDLGWFGPAVRALVAEDRLRPVEDAPPGYLVTELSP